MSWIDFLNDYKIDYEVVSSKNVETTCPFCIGHTGHKLGLSTINSLWGCWRDETFRGANPATPIRQFLNCDWAEAKRLAALYFNWQHKDQPKEEELREYHPATKPPEFLEFGTSEVVEKPFISYLKQRGFDPKWAISRYKLMYAVSGRYAYRLIIPVHFNRTLATWTARAIDPEAKRRYLNASVPQEVANRTTDHLFDVDNLDGGYKLVICEGPLDCMKINSAMIPGIGITALFGKQISTKQRLNLIQLASKYADVVLALDSDAQLTSRGLSQQLATIMNKPFVSCIAPESKDFGEMSIQSIRAVVNA